jgi:hypothetical protein
MNETNKPEEIQEYEQTFERYLDICNRAIERNKDRFPYMDIWKARWNNMGPRKIMQCAVFDDRPKVIYTLELTDDMKIKIIEETQVPPEGVWPLKYTYLKEVTENPQKYIEHPAELVWGWLTGVFG